MNILVVGLGLIGGSLCKALKKYTEHTVIGSNRNQETIRRAVIDKSIDKAFDGSFDDVDMVINCLYPEAAEEYYTENAPKMKNGTILTDVCGIKGEFSRRMTALAEQYGLHYIGMHPMAGKEVGGYVNSTADLFVRANFIITPFEGTDKEGTEKLRKLCEDIGGGKIVITTPENHDKMIAYTSQLAHVVSNAYVKSPELELECGFSGGSFQDMTRTATMNETMWTELFLQNRENLLFELDTLISNLKKYSEALENRDREKLVELITEGRELKEANIRRRVGQPN